MVEIKNHPNYLIDEQGNVFNQKTNRVMHHAVNNTGYFTCYVDGKNRLLHRLLAETFLPNPDNLPCINHKDGNKHNNDLTNLEWCTHSENNSHAYKTGLKGCRNRKGDKAFNRKLTSKDVVYIREHYKRYDPNFGGRALSKKFNVSESCISAIVKNKNWGCL